MMDNYAEELLACLLQREELNIYSCHMKPAQHLHTEFSTKFCDRLIRATMIDKLFSIGSIQALKMTDKGIIYQAISSFDRYYQRVQICFTNYKHAKTLNPEEQQKPKILDPLSISSYDDYMNLDVSKLDSKVVKQVKSRSDQDLMVAGMTALFI